MATKPLIPLRKAIQSLQAADPDGWPEHLVRVAVEVCDFDAHALAELALAANAASVLATGLEEERIEEEEEEAEEKAKRSKSPKPAAKKSKGRKK